MPDLTYFRNYAGAGKEHGIDDILDAELVAAGIPPAQRMESLRGQVASEIDTVSCGQLGPWFFRRFWRYWVAEGPGIPPEDATRLWEQCGGHCRVGGHACGPSPAQEYSGFAVPVYHIDTAEGLKALADTIKAIMARNEQAKGETSEAISQQSQP